MRNVSSTPVIERKNLRHQFNMSWKKINPFLLLRMSLVSIVKERKKKHPHTFFSKCQRTFHYIAVLTCCKEHSCFASSHQYLTAVVVMNFFFFLLLMWLYRLARKGLAGCQQSVKRTQGDWQKACVRDNNTSVSQLQALKTELSYVSFCPDLLSFFEWKMFFKQVTFHLKCLIRE